MPKSRIEIQKNINNYKAAIASREDPTSDSMSDPEVQKIQNKEKLELIDLEKELAEAKARGEKGRSLEEIRREIFETESKENEFRSAEYRATNPMQRFMCHSSANYMQCTVDALQQELNEVIKENAEKDKAEIEKIKQLYENEINSSPNNAGVYIERGVNFFARGMADGENPAFYDQAIADFNKATEIDSNAKDAYLNRAGLYSKINDFDGAIADYNKVIQLDPNNAEAYTFRGAALSQKGKYDQALSDFNDAIRIDPKIKNAYAFRGLTYFTKGVQNKENADYDNAVVNVDKAIADIEEALKLEPNDVNTAGVLENVKNEKPIVERMRRERQEQYDRLVKEMKTALTEEKYQDLARQLMEMSGYKDTTELANKCDNRYQELKSERERNEAEETAKREAKKKRNRQNGVLAAVIAVAALIAFIAYRQTGSFFQFQQNAQGEMTITGYSGKKQVIIPAAQNGANVTEIGYNAFSGKKLSSITIPDGVTIIGENAFRDNRLTSVVIPDSVTVIGNYAFFNNKLTEVTLGSSVTSIGDFAFAGSTDSNDNATYDGNRLTSVNIPDSVTRIGHRAFRINRLTSVTIGNNVEFIGNRAFSGNLLTSVTLPNSVTYIDEAAFISNQLISIVIPNNVTTVEASAFYNNKLTSVVIGNKVNAIGNSVFEKNSLTNIIIPNSVKSIGYNVLSDNPITSVRIGANVKLGSNDDWGVLGKGTGFNTFYDNNGKRAGTYTRPNADSAAWTRR